MNRILRPLRRFFHPAPPESSYPVVLRTKIRPPRGRVLFSYIEHGLLWDENDERLDGHSNAWESRAIAYSFLRAGFEVVGIRWNDHEYIPEGEFDILFDIHANLSRLAPLLPERALKILHLTGSDPFYQNHAEQIRLEALKKRRGCECIPRRALADAAAARRSLELADVASLLGNEYTLATFPDELRRKIHLVAVSGSRIAKACKTPSQYVPKERKFLWFFGSGAVHKGLDLTLEVFAGHPEWPLNVVGNATEEEDFAACYQKELAMSHIQTHGYVVPSSESFEEISRRCFCFVAPTCSEGTSAAVITCLQVGLYPIISRNTGVTLPDDCGIYLEQCTVEEIEAAVRHVMSLPAEELTRQIAITQEYALQRYSREAFVREMDRFIQNAITQWERR